MVKPGKRLPSSIEFFKVFLSNLSSHQLSLPPAFVVRLEGNVPKNATLKDHFGKIWDVQLVKTESSLTIKQGWEEFVNHYSLAYGDFLTFKYDMNSQFNVKVFGTNGLKKKKKVVSSKGSAGSTDVKEEPETDEGKTRSESTSGCKRKYSEMASKQTERSIGRPRGSKSKLRQSTGSPGGNRNTVKKTMVSKRGRPKMKAPTYVKPKNPYFVMTMTRTARYSVYVHKSVVNEHNIKLQEKLKLLDENGDLWPVKVCFRTDGRIIISEGWLAFHKKHKVAKNDTCVFEFIPKENNNVEVIQVQIVRKQVMPKKKKA